MSKRKQLVNKLMGKDRKNVKPLPNIKKREETEPEITEKNVPDQFKKRMQSLSKEELITELFFSRVELMHTKRDLELTTFKLTELQRNMDE